MDWRVSTPMQTFTPGRAATRLGHGTALHARKHHRLLPALKSRGYSTSGDSGRATAHESATSGNLLRFCYIEGSRVDPLTSGPGCYRISRKRSNQKLDRRAPLEPDVKCSTPTIEVANSLRAMARVALSIPFHLLAGQSVDYELEACTVPHIPVFQDA